jgi:hypothetical protein
MLRFMFCVLAAAACYAAPQLTTIQDVLFRADGTRFKGTAFIEWKSFEAADSSQIGSQAITAPIIDGRLNVKLVPTTGKAYYTVRYNSDGRVQFTETWVVKASSTPLRINQVRVGPECLDGQTGGPLVQGGSGPAFVDSEIPAGLVDGHNASFMLSQAPEPAASLELFRNGVRQKAGLDFTLSGSTVTFLPVAIPSTGDVLLASYRLTDPTNPAGAAGGALAGSFPNPVLGDGVVSNSNIANTAAIIESKLALNYPTHSNAADPQVVCSAPGSATASTAAVRLGVCTLPANTLQPGDRLELRADFAHTGVAAGFTVRLRWGAAEVLSRAVASSEPAFSLRFEAGAHTGGVQWGVQTWGGTSAVLASAGAAADPLGAPIVVDVLGSMASAGTDTIALRNFTVIRYPGR